MGDRFIPPGGDRFIPLGGDSFIPDNLLNPQTYPDLGRTAGGAGLMMSPPTASSSRRGG